GRMPSSSFLMIARVPSGALLAHGSRRARACGAPAWAEAGAHIGRGARAAPIRVLGPALLGLAGIAPGTGAQDVAVAAPCREEDDPPATFEHRGVQVTISESCWKRRVGNQ